MARSSSNQLLKMEQMKSCQLEKTSQRAEIWSPSLDVQRRLYSWVWIKSGYPEMGWFVLKMDQSICGPQLQVDLQSHRNMNYIQYILYIQYTYPIVRLVMKPICQRFWGPFCTAAGFGLGAVSFADSG